ncbi:unnamed protein product [Lampetra fluviatilis]
MAAVAVSSSSLSACVPTSRAAVVPYRRSRPEPTASLSPPSHEVGLSTGGKTVYKAGQGLPGRASWVWASRAGPPGGPAAVPIAAVGHRGRGSTEREGRGEGGEMGRGDVITTEVAPVNAPHWPKVGPTLVPALRVVPGEMDGMHEKGCACVCVRASLCRVCSVELLTQRA